MITTKWDLLYRNQNEIQIGLTQNKLSPRRHELKMKKTNDRPRYSWEYSKDYVFFTFFKAIHVGRLWEFNRFDLRVETNYGKDIITEFTIQDIDAHGANEHTLLYSGLISGGISFIVA